MLKWSIVVLLWSIVVPVALVGIGTANPLLAAAAVIIAVIAYILTAIVASRLPEPDGGRVYPESPDAGIEDDYISHIHYRDLFM